MSARPDRRHLEAFLAVVDRGGFAAAGRHLGVSQSAVSQALRQLEQLLGAELFVRSARPFRLTTTGQAVEPHARRSLRDLDSLVAAATHGGGTYSGVLTLCVIPTMSVQPVGPLVGAFRAAHPHTRVDIIQPPSFSIAEVSRTVRSGLADVGVSEFPMESRSLQSLEFERQEFVAILPPDSPHEGPTIDAAEFAAHGLVIGPYFESSVAYSTLKRRAPGLDSSIVIRTDHRGSFTHLVAGGVGATLVQNIQAPVARALGCKVATFEPPLLRRSGIVYSAEYRSPAAGAFVQLCREVARG